jgi:acetyl-CoA acetyltransferase
MREPRARGDGGHRALGRPGGRVPGLGPRDQRQPLLRLLSFGAISIAHAIRSDELSVGLAAGVESMSRSGWAFMKGEASFMPRGPVLLLDTMWAGAGGPPNPALLARNAYIEMMQTAQNVADRYELTREEIDAFALRSHQHAAAARDSGRLAEEIKPVEIPASRKQPARTFEHDEGIRDDTSAEKLAALPAQPNTTQITAGNSSALNDGASGVVLASAEAADELGVEPLARWSPPRPTRSTRR